MPETNDWDDWVANKIVGRLVKLLLQPITSVTKHQPINFYLRKFLSLSSSASTSGSGSLLGAG